jgi:hypothetical protein
MERLLGYLRQNLGKRHVCLSRQPDGQEAFCFQAMGRNGNWPVTITLEKDIGEKDIGEKDAGALAICSTLPLTIDRSRRQAIAELVTRLNDAAEEGHFAAPDASGRIRYRSRHDIPAGTGTAGLRLAIERHVAAVDGDLSSFFAVVAGGQTPTEAVDQLERMRRYG